MPESVVTVGFRAFKVGPTVYCSKNADISGWHEEHLGMLNPCIFAYEGKYPYVYSIDVSDLELYIPKSEEKFWASEFLVKRYGTYENYMDEEVKRSISKYTVPSSKWKEGNTKKFLGWTTEEGSDRVEYSVREYPYTINLILIQSPFNGMTFMADVWIATEEFDEFLDRYHKEDYRPVLYAIYG